MQSPLFPYDLSVYKLLHNLYDEVCYGSPEEIFSINAKRHRGKVVMPFIGVYRMPDFSVNSEYLNEPMLREGIVSRVTRTPGVEFSGQKVAFHALPVTLQYQIDIYATKRDVCDGLTSELVMYLKEHPYIDVQILDAGKRVIQFNFDLDESVMDNTDISGFDEMGRFYRLTLTATITSALLLRLDEFPKIEKIYIDFEDTVKKSEEELIEEQPVDDNPGWVSVDEEIRGRMEMTENQESKG